MSNENNTSSTGKNNQTIIVALLLVAVAGGAFFGGMKYQQTKKPEFGQFNISAIGGKNSQMMVTRGSQGQGQGNRAVGFSPVSGEIISADDKSITVKMTDGSSKIVLFSETTSINKADTATAADLKTGETVAVFGQTNSDGSVTAQNIQLNPISNFRSPVEVIQKQ